MTTTHDTPSMRTVAALERIADALERIDRRQDRELRERHHLLSLRYEQDLSIEANRGLSAFMHAHAADIARWGREDAQAGGGE